MTSIFTLNQKINQLMFTMDKMQTAEKLAPPVQCLSPNGDGNHLGGY